MTQRTKRRGPTQAAQGKLLNHIESLRPHDLDQLHQFVKVMMGITVPRKALFDANQAPMDYLAHTFFESRDEHGGDVVVWAARGTGKTMLGAVATLLDLLFKPGIEVRILGGSLDQSSRMYDYLRQLVHRPAFRKLLASEPTQRRMALVNHSRVQVMTQSQTSVRGHHVQKMRCDEVELFKSDIWQAAQLVTRSRQCGPVAVRGTVEALSTMHLPYGLMSRIVSKPGVRLFRWCALDMVEKCSDTRDCGTCPLWEDCQGRARQAQGFVKIDDLIRQKQRTSRQAWESEMMCRRPRQDASVYPNFDPAVHVVGQAADEKQSNQVKDDSGVLIGGMDFGLRSPLVMLWAQVRPATDGMQETVVRVVDEYCQSGLTLENHLDIIAGRGWPVPQWLGVDPAGRQRNAHSGMSDIDLLRRRGYRVRSRPSSIRDGIERIRRRLDHRTLLIDPSCTRLIEAMTRYHFDTDHPQVDQPVKDGPDHLCDALRYMILNFERGSGRVSQRHYAGV